MELELKLEFWWPNQREFRIDKGQLRSRTDKFN